MEESFEVIPQQEVEKSDSAKRSEMCGGWTIVMILPKDTVTGVTIVIPQYVTNDIPKRTQLVTNSTLKGK